jgi:hypothetical protein
MGDLYDDFAEQFAKRAAAGEFDGKIDDFMENEAIPVWRSHSPEGTGRYRKSVQVAKKAKGGKGQIAAKHRIANIIEYGGEHVPEYAPRTKTEAHFNPLGPP